MHDNKGEAQAIDSETPPVSTRDQAIADRRWDLVRMWSYKLCAQADAWKQLHAELSIDPEALVRDLPVYDSVKLTEEAARLWPWTAEEATAYRMDTDR
jgi:hypothetical protein